MRMLVRYLTIVKRHFRWKYALVFIFFLLLITFLKLFDSLSHFAPLDSVKNIYGEKVTTTTLQTLVRIGPEKMKEVMTRKKQNLLSSNFTDMKLRWLKEKVERLNKMAPKPEAIRVVVNNETLSAGSKVHIFYYAWYESEEYDGVWQHWNHEYLKNWMKNDRRIYPTGRHSPPDDIGSNYYPKLGCYSSRDPSVIDQHMGQIKNAGIGVLIVSWYPPGLSDGPASRSSDTVFLQLLDAASRFGLKIAPHVEPYKNRNPHNFLRYLKYFTSTYRHHPALLKMNRNGKNLIVYYIYDSYRTPAFAWKELFDPKGNMSVRGTEEDGIFLGLLVDASHKLEIRRARFDGFYTYFATNGFTYGSTWKNWKTLALLARSQNLIFVPSIGPGYIDTRIRPWNAANTRHRRRGKYYEVGWRAAINAGVSHVSVTSFNEWHEGTQIEPAVAKATRNFTYLDYEPEGPDFYLNLTKYWIREFTRRSSKS